MTLPVEITIVLVLAYSFHIEEGVLVWLTLHIVNPGIFTSFPFFPFLLAIPLLTITSVVEHKIKIKSEGLKAPGFFIPWESP